MTPNTDFDARRGQLSDKIAALRAERGQALLDGKAWDDAALIKAEREREALDDGIAAHSQRARFVTSDAYKKQRAANVAALLEKDAERLEAIRRFEAASRAQSAAVRELHKICAEELKLFTALKKPQPDKVTTSYDLGWQLLAAQMSTWDGAHPCNYGFIKWRSSRFTDKTDWAATMAITNLKEIFDQ